MVLDVRRLVGFHARIQGLGEPRLADARRTGQDDDLAGTATGRPPALVQDRELGFAPDQRRGARPRLRFLARIR
jgi:hypothetical protein